MRDLYIGVAQISVLLRHAQSLKDKRQVLQSIKQKLRNLGFSVTESGYAENPKQGSIGIAYAGHQHGAVERMLKEGLSLFIGPLEVVRCERDIFDYSEMKEESFEVGEYP